MLVDDETDILNTLKRALENHGFEVDAFSNPNEALAAFRPDVYDILVLDFRMPGLSGIQLFKQMRLIDPNVKALFLTAFEILEREWHMVLPSTEVYGLFKKPIRIEDLVHAINHAKASDAY